MTQIIKLIPAQSKTVRIWIRNRETRKIIRVWKQEVTNPIDIDIDALDLEPGQYTIECSFSSVPLTFTDVEILP